MARQDTIWTTTLLNGYHSLIVGTSMATVSSLYRISYTTDTYQQIFKLSGRRTAILTASTMLYAGLQSFLDPFVPLLFSGTIPGLVVGGALAQAKFSRTDPFFSKLGSNPRLHTLQWLAFGVLIGTAIGPVVPRYPQ